MTSDIIPLKRLLRRRWERPMADTQRELVLLKRRVTELCILRAWLRGRLHVRHPPRGSSPDWEPQQAAERIATRVALAYALPAPRELEETA